MADIPAIKAVDGNVTTDPKEINKPFQTFYSDLYQSQVTAVKSRCDSWLNQLDLPQLSTNLEKSISLEE